MVTATWMKNMASKLLRFTKVLKNGTVFYRFEGFENVDSRWELPCEYLSGLHFAAWNGILLYSDGKTLFSLTECAYSELMSIIDAGKKRLREIRNCNSF